MEPALSLLMPADGQFVFTGRRKCREVLPEPAWEKMFTVLLDVVLLILPLFVMAVMYGLIVRHLWKVDQGKQ